MTSYAPPTVSVSMTTPGGAHDATATWAKVGRAAPKVGAWGRGERGGGSQAGRQGGVWSLFGSFLNDDPVLLYLSLSLLHRPNCEVAFVASH